MKELSQHEQTRDVLFRHLLTKYQYDEATALLEAIEAHAMSCAIKAMVGRGVLKDEDSHAGDKQR